MYPTSAGNSSSRPPITLVGKSKSTTLPSCCSTFLYICFPPSFCSAVFHRFGHDVVPQTTIRPQCCRDERSPVLNKWLRGEFLEAIKSAKYPGGHLKPFGQQGRQRSRRPSSTPINKHFEGNFTNCLRPPPRPRSRRRVVSSEVVVCSSSRGRRYTPPWLAGGPLERCRDSGLSSHRRCVPLRFRAVQGGGLFLSRRYRTH